MKRNISTYKEFFESMTEHEFPEYWYHGSNQKFDDFSIEHMGKNWHQSELGIYFTQYMKPPPFSSTAKEYAEEMVRREGGNPYIYKCIINFENPLILDSNGWYSSNTYIDQNRKDIKRWIENDDHDCVIAYDFENKDGIEWSDFILATKNIDMIEIVDRFEYQ